MKNKQKTIFRISAIIATMLFLSTTCASASLVNIAVSGGQGYTLQVNNQDSEPVNARYETSLFIDDCWKLLDKGEYMVAPNTVSLVHKNIYAKTFTPVQIDFMCPNYQVYTFVHKIGFVFGFTVIFRMESEPVPEIELP